MDSSNGILKNNENPSQILSREAVPFLEEGIFLVLSRWTALQMAVENEWGGRESRRKSEELASAILSWFNQSKEPLYIDDLENLLDENMEHSFNTEIADGSVEEVAEQLMVIFDDLLQGNFASIENLRKAAPGTISVSQSRQAEAVDDDDVDESSDGEGSDMLVDKPPETEIVGDETEKIQVPDEEEGWCSVPPRRHRGKMLGLNLRKKKRIEGSMAAVVISLCASIGLPSIVMHCPQRHCGLRKLIPLKCMEHFANMKSGRKLIGSKSGASHRRLVVLAVTEGSAKSRPADDKIPSWAKPDSDEPPPWARDEGAKSTAQPTFVIPFYAYLLASVVTAIAAIGSIFEYINQKPVFGVLSSDSMFYAPLLGFFAFTGIPTSAFLWFRSVQAANKEAEEQDRRDGYS